MIADRQAIGTAVGRIPSGCSILSVEHDGRRSGMLVSWVQQAAFEPLVVTVALKRGRPVGELVAGAGKFVLNVIGDEPAAMFRHFGKGFAPDQDAFAGLRLETSEFGPVLADCIAHLGCRVMQSVAVGDHDLIVAEVVAGAAQAGSKPHVHLRSSGHSY